jgi:hypothetical protein
MPDGLREVGGGIGGFLPIGGGGFGFMPILDATDDGLESFNAPKMGFGGGRPPGTGGAGGAPGGFGADPRGGFGTELRDVSGSDRYGALPWSAPVLTPPAFLSFGMPPANSPPSCGGAATPLSPVSLLLRARFPPGGASPPGGAGGLPMPGIGGAPAIAGAAGPSDTLPTIGADRSLTTPTFFSRAPFPMSVSSAPCDVLAVALCHADSRGAAFSLQLGVPVTYSSSSRWRLCSRCLHARHWRRWWWPASASSHGRHGRRRRWWGHRVVCALAGVAVFLLLCVYSCSFYGVLLPGLVCRCAKSVV